MTSKGFGSQADLKHQCEILLDHQTQYVKLIDERRRAEDEMMERIYIKEISEINREYEGVKNQVKAKILTDLQQKRKKWHWIESDVSDSCELPKLSSVSQIAPLRPLRKLRKRGNSLPKVDPSSEDNIASILLNGKGAGRQTVALPSTYQALKDHEIEADIKLLFSSIET
ncbi:hypothetical protein DI09_67p60 [Mitosporidium daphniae]|uniref:Uncharacterized protein n=1 Tax=Mitosporidium daphniae TaxID=1485682 RepID=A0A098VN89_9MICR|nr:uncharacterized protein DI09_67p60 [Mitosporidium daphniae]KGG50518.1 hypothetical protein DI09_67p60 [Mitosporidium daphniae]|eukprot:XP_013236969.1 uncharacterized protein DI09_67p60 [Mitosporidium daphniae]